MWKLECLRENGCVQILIWMIKGLSCCSSLRLGVLEIREGGRDIKGRTEGECVCAFEHDGKILWLCAVCVKNHVIYVYKELQFKQWLILFLFRRICNHIYTCMYATACKEVTQSNTHADSWTKRNKHWCMPAKFGPNNWLSCHCLFSVPSAVQTQHINWNIYDVKFRVKFQMSIQPN